MPTIKGRIESATFFKSGQGAKGPWVIFEVVINGQKFTGFGESWQKQVGQEGEFEYKEEQRTSPKGTIYMSRTLSSQKRGGVNPQQLQSLEKKLDEILSILRGPGSLRPITNQSYQPSGYSEPMPGPMPEPPSQYSQGEVSPDDIPF